jgi:ACS family hexuronate transporter-like MFS transporter
MTVSYVDRQTLSALAPAVTHALDIGDTGYGWLLSAFAFAYLVATPLAGRIIDRIGARRGLVGSLAVWSSIAALHALVPTFGVLFTLRIALGLAEGPGFPGAAQTVHRVLPAGERARGYGILFAGSSIGSMIAPPLASWLYGVAGWRVAFLTSAAVGALWLVPWLALTQRAEVREVLDRPQPAKPDHGLRVFKQLVTNPAMVRGLVAIFAAAPAIAFVLSWGAKYLAGTFGVAQVSVGHYLWLPPLLFDVGVVGFGDLVTRLGAPRRLFATGLALACVIALLPLAATPWQSVVVLGFALIGGGALYTLATADVLSRVPDDQISFAGGVLACAQSLAAIVTSPLVGWLVTRTHGYDTVAIALAVWVVPGSVAWLVWPTRSAAGSRSIP